MFKIGQFANLSQVSVKTLRYYDDIGILSPVKIDKYTGYRYYAAKQLYQLNKIFAFKDMGFSLSEITDLLNNNVNEPEITAILHLKKAQLKSEIRNANTKLKRVEDLIKQFKEERNIMYDVSVKKVESFKVASYKELRKNYSDQGEMWQVLTDYITEHGAKIGAGCFVSYYNTSQNAVEIEVFEPIDKAITSSNLITVKDMPEVTVASVIHKGSFTKLKHAYAYLAEWIEKNDYEIIDVAREIYLAGEWNCDSEDEYISEIQMPVKKC